MVLRIHFTGEDLAHTRLAQRARPFLEVGLALWRLRQPAHAARSDAWQWEAARRLEPSLRRLTARHPRARCSDFLWTPTAAEDPREALETVLATPPAQVRKQVARACERYRTGSAWTHRLGDGFGALDHYGKLLRSVHNQVIKPSWHRIGTSAAPAWARHGPCLASAGIESVLARLEHCGAHWSPPVLHIDSPGDQDVHLGGRGLILIPTLLGGDPFLGTDPFDVEDGEPQRWLTFSLRRAEQPLPTADFTASGRPPQPLSTLLGRNRAAVLCAIAERPRRTTTQLSQRVGIATASASEHATILRAAGLTTAARHHNMVLHTVTAAGRSLLHACAG
ncbi:winged helix-turn-helix domain-containing protein [Streptomyces sp. OE57]|uniref:winged helix-turn-helix domain-containing protein n=1 Tax=Streptomyces lacaronensis TaxID=3379885 RepID=UPI0039B764E7